MLTVEEALERVLRRVVPLPVESVTLSESLGRTLAEDVVADTDSPAFANSAVDGYAVRAVDTASAPVALNVVAEIHAGSVSNEIVAAGTTMRIMTGAPIPDGADAIVMQEDTSVDHSGAVTIRESARVGQHVRPAGGDVRAGDTVLNAGDLIGPAEIAMLATVGRVHLSVHRTPRVAVISTGDEVVPADSDPLPRGCIRDSNLPMLVALVTKAGADVIACAHVLDDLESTVETFRRLSRGPNAADVIVTAGGVSVGDRDFVKPALERLGTLDLWRVAMKPGKPLAFGSIDKTLFFGLPGNPASVSVTFELFVLPALQRLSGRPASRLARRHVTALAVERVDHQPGRREYVRAITTFEDGRYVTRTTGGQGSGLIHSLTRANSLLIVPEESDGVNPGETVNVMLLR